MKPAVRPTPLLLWALISTSSIVIIEPAPYEFLMMGLIVGLFSSGLKLPSEIATAAFFLGCFVIGNIVASAMSAEPLTTLFSLSVRTYMVLSWFFLVSVISTDPKTLLRYVWSGYVVAAMIAIAWGFAELGGMLPYDDIDPVRVQGPFKDPNVLGPFLVPVAIYSIHRVFETGLAGAPKYMAIFLITGFGIFLSFSRGGFLNLVLSFGIYITLAVLFSRSIRKKLSLVLLAPTIAFLFLAMTLISISVSTEMRERLVERAVLIQPYDVADDGRFASTWLALESAGSNPIGVGPGNTAALFGLEPHNLYVHVLAEGGWLAAFGFYGFIVLTLWRSLSLLPVDTRLRKENILIVSCLLGTLAQSLFIDSTHWRHLWLLFALSWIPSLDWQRHAVRRRVGIMSSAKSL